MPDETRSVIDRRHIGTEFPPFTVSGEASRLRFFAQASGQTAQVDSIEAAARAAGHPGLPVPPRFLFCLQMEAPKPAALREALGLDFSRILHGEQGLTLHRTAQAALVVLKPGQQHAVTAEQFIAWCHEQMAVYKAARSVEFVASLPKSNTGKILWRELQQNHQTHPNLEPPP